MEIIYRDHKPTVPPQVFYGLMKEGKELTTILDEINSLAYRWQARNQKSRKMNTG